MATSPYNPWDICPTVPELTDQYLLLLPRGRAWGEGGPAREPGGILYGWIVALATMFQALHAAICALIPEFVCSTADVTLPVWMEEYGLPDGCDPYPDLCAKVAAYGGCTCAYYEEIALSIGWSIACGVNCAADVGQIMAGQTIGPTYAPAVLQVVVSLADSPAYTSTSQTFGAATGCLEAGMQPVCGPDLTALKCLLARIVHAHVQLVYFTI